MFYTRSKNACLQGHFCAAVNRYETAQLAATSTIGACPELALGFNIFYLWFIIAQVFGAITICIDFFAYQDKRPRSYLLKTSIASIAWFFCFLFMALAAGWSTSISLLVISSISFIRGIGIYFFYNKTKAKRVFFCTVMCLALGGWIVSFILVPPEVLWLHLVLFVTGTIYSCSQMTKNTIFLRIAAFIYAVFVAISMTPINLLYGEFRWNITGIVIAAFECVAILTFLTRRKVNLEQHKVTNEMKCISNGEHDKSVADTMEKKIATVQALRDGWRRIERGSLYCEVPEPVSLAGRFAVGDVQGNHPGGKFILYPGDLLVGYVLNTDKKGKDLQAQKKSALYYLSNKFCEHFKHKIKGVCFTKTNCDLLAKNKKFGATVSHYVELGDSAIISIHFLISVVKNKQKTKEILACEKSTDYKGNYRKRTKRQICCTNDYGIIYDDLVSFFKTVTCDELEQMNIDYSEGKTLPNFKDCE